ncbi:MAG: 50S ribosomal protein L25 [Chloroflexaceae bacterium]|nr:50S ribosomal protein L25 [Chloroflexaceae bacterium]NJO04181.1 50S ribosomal protein L25 [Chloroflexaceae bacterium]
MTTPILLEARPREVLGKKVSTLRKQGILPATVYGKNVEPIAIQIDERAFANTFRKVGTAVLVDLHIAGHDPIQAFIHTIQRHPVSRNVVHADFRAVNLNEETRADVPVGLVGMSSVVARGDAIVNQTLYAVRVRAKPTDMPPRVDVDMSKVERLGQPVYVRNLALSDVYTIETPGDTIIVSLTGIKRRGPGGA